MNNLIKIKNIGNTCYFNACIQIFLNSNILNEYILQNCNCSNTFCSYYKLFLNNKNEQNLIAIMKYLECKNIQMDSYEFILKIIDSIEHCNQIKNVYSTKYLIKQNNSSTLSPIQSTLHNNSQSIIQQLELSHFITYHSFIEIVHNKNIIINNYPYYLFIYTLNENKLYDSIKISSKNNGKVKYILEKILCFIGSDNSGHYFTLVKVNEQWYNIDDDTITKINSNEYSTLIKYHVICIYTRY